MASLASGSVTTVRTWYEWVNPFRRRTCKLVRATINTMGTIANPIPADAFGLTEIEEVSNMVNDDNTLIIPTAVSYDRSKVVTMLVTNATDATRGAPVDLANDTYQFVVKGR